MNWFFALPILVVLSSMIPGILIFFLAEESVKLRTTFNIGGALIKLIFIAFMLTGVYFQYEYEARVPLMPGFDFVLHASALSMLFVVLSGFLWLLTTIYAIGYLENSPNRSRFFGFFSLCVSATTGIALAGNLITFIIFYEFLTLATYPLVVHRGTRESLAAGRIYLGYTLAGGALLLVGVIWLHSLIGPFDFQDQGIFNDGSYGYSRQMTAIFFLIVAGLGVKASLVPMHSWLPIAMVAPAPVSALLHAVAVVKAGAFGIVRVIYNVFGVPYIAVLNVAPILASLAAATILYGSFLALFQDGLKRRLAFSTISQVSYIMLGASILGPIATIGGVVHLVHQGLMKITLFFCAGNISETLGIHRISQLNGVGRRMPVTMLTFSVAALGMIGIPPLAGFVSKWYLAIGAAEVEQYWVLIVLIMSSILNAAYFLPILYIAWFKPADQSWPVYPEHGKYEANKLLLWPPIITGLLVIAVGLFANLAISPLRWVILIAERIY